jgi:ribosomal-protein-alanine N-acetyltransferase
VINHRLIQVLNKNESKAKAVISPRTPKVYLREPTTEDQAELLALNRSSRKFHQGLVSPASEPAQYLSLLERAHSDSFAYFLVCRKKDDAILGVINLSQIFHGPFRSAYLGYYIGKKHAGQGYMTEALQLMLFHAFDKLKLHRLEANIQPGNTASIALVKRAGFVREGFSRRYLKIGGKWRDHERWAIMVEDWKVKTRKDRKR